MPITKSLLRIPYNPVVETSPLPFFREEQDKPIRNGGLLPEEVPGFAKETGFRVLPYRMQDLYEAVPTARDMPVIVLENEYLKATFLPTLGGRLYSLWDQKDGRELLFANPAIKLGNLALRNAWFSGGIEWNFGHYGHTFFTCEDVFFARCEAEGGEFLRMYVFERVKRMTYQVDFHLPGGARHLTAHMVLYNPSPEAVPVFLWTNAAVPEEPGARVFSGTDQVIIQVESEVPSESRFTHAALPDPTGDGIDHSYPECIPHAEEYFFQNPKHAAHAWESVAYPDGRVTYERSTGNYPYRKMFCWGGHKGGKRWQEHLSRPGEGAYIEIQSGFFRTQQHTGSIGPGETWSLTQLFGGACANYGSFSGEYGEARANMRRLIDGLLPPEAVEQAHGRCAPLSTLPAREILHSGTGWGALEALRNPKYLPPHLNFPADGVGAEQSPWAALLRGEPFPGADSFMTAPEWLPILEAAHATRPDDAKLLTHLGIALYENGRRDEAVAHWETAALAPEPLALRNLSFAAACAGDEAAALRAMVKAVAALSAPNRAYAEEYLMLLTGAGQYAEAWAFYRSLPEALQKTERLSITACFSAFELGEDGFLAEQFARTFSVVKEGEMAFIALWFRREAAREAERRGVPLTEALIREVKKTANLPHNLDFRMLS